MPCADASCPYGLLRRFTFHEIHSIPSSAGGIYGFWYQRRCLYIGQAISLSSRLAQHWRQSHNSRLRTWLQAKGRDIHFAICVIPLGENLDIIENQYISAFDPVTNVVKPKNTISQPHVHLNS